MLFPAVFFVLEEKDLMHAHARGLRSGKRKKADNDGETPIE